MAPNLSKYQRIGLALALLCASDQIKLKKTREQKRKMRKWVQERNRNTRFNFSNLIQSNDLFNYLRMDQAAFDELLELVRPHITKKNTNMRQAVTAERRLIATLTYIATGRNYKDLAFSTGMSYQLLSVTIPETCRAIYRVLKNLIKMPSTENEWKQAAKQFEEHWQFSNCVGSLGGKHILIEKPPGTGSLFRNHKGTFSIVLLAVINANYEFIYVHTGSNGSLSNGAVIEETKFYEKLSDNELELPESCFLPGTDVMVPYVFAADDAFELKTHIMTPFPDQNISKEKRTFNYRLSRAQRVADNVFGILASRFGVFRQQILLDLENVDAIVLASCVLHNYLRHKSEKYWTPTTVDHEDVNNLTFTPGDWRHGNSLTPLHSSKQSYTIDGEDVREKFTEYFNGAGRLTFQDKMATINDKVLKSIQ